MRIVTIGIDLAKNVFAVHGVDAVGKDVLVRPSVARGAGFSERPRKLGLGSHQQRLSAKSYLHEAAHSGPGLSNKRFRSRLASLTRSNLSR